MINVIARQFLLFSVLRHRDFRIFWLGTVAQVTGQQMMQFTMGWLAFELTKSPLLVGSVVLFLGIPPLTVGLFGGVIADRVDQRRVIRTAQGIATVGWASWRHSLSRRISLHGISWSPRSHWGP